MESLFCGIMQHIVCPLQLERNVLIFNVIMPFYQVNGKLVWTIHVASTMNTFTLTILFTKEDQGRSSVFTFTGSENALTIVPHALYVQGYVGTAGCCQTDAIQKPY